MILQQQIIQDLLIWIENNLEEPLNIDIIAAKAGYSKWHLQRMFKHTTKCTLASYIRSLRLKKAADDLVTKKLSVTDLALKYQFDSLPSFIRAFKQQFKQTPTYYRQQHKLLQDMETVNMKQSNIAKYHQSRMYPSRGSNNISATHSL